MISFLLSKIWKNKWIMLCLLIGNVMLIGIVSGTPIYTQASMQRILIKDMEQVQIDRNVHPAIMEVGYNFNNTPEEDSVSIFNTVDSVVVDHIINAFNINVQRVVRNLILDNVRVVPAEARENNPRMRTLHLNTFEGFENYLTITHGRMPSNELVDGNIIEVIVNHRTMSRRDLLLGELLTVTNIRYDDENDIPTYYMRIVGVYEASADQELFWTSNPNFFLNEALVSHELVMKHFVENFDEDISLSAKWLIMLDFYSMSAHNISNYFAANRHIRNEFTWVTQNIVTFGENFISTLAGYVERTNRLTITLLVLQVPVYIFLAFYIFIISRQILFLEQNDISILKSRGVSRKQILLIYLIQSLLVSIVSILLGIPLGMLVCRFLGASSGFLELVSRAALTVQVNRYAFIYSGIAAAISILMMLIPVIGFSRVTIVEHKRRKTGKLKKPIWQQFFLDILFLGISGYGYYNFLSRREILALTAVEVHTVDPMLFLSSSLFIIGFGLLCLRLYPYLVRLIFKIGNKLWSPAFYASLLKVIRFSNEEQFIMIFLIFTLSLGIFSAKTARTLNTNSEHMIKYEIGADLVFAERFRDNVPPAMPGAPIEMPDRIIYTEPDFERFTGFPEVDSITRVMRGTLTNIRRDRTNLGSADLMAIDTQTFGETVWFRDDLLPVHINFFLNALAVREDGVLLSSNFRTRYGVQVGETIQFTDSYGNRMNGVVVGFVDHWPTYSSRVSSIGAGGVTVFSDAYLVIANLGHIHSMWGMYPYQVWMRTNTPSNRFFYEFAEENELNLIRFDDAKADVVSSRNNPILQGTNGILTSGFILMFVACFTGFLIYWTLSIKSRVLQFGVFRAMGMTKRNLISLLIYEQVFITFFAIGIGILVGEIASMLFVPMIQIAYSPSLQAIPLLIVVEGRDYANIFSIIGFMVVLCLVILGILISKVKIAQALKLGED